MRVTFWGTRGSLVVPGTDTVRYGGNTPCVEVATGGTNLILDAGIGIVPLGDKVMAAPAGERRQEFHILFSHFHWDHVLGFPFFVPVYIPGMQLHLYGRNPDRVRETVHRLFHSSYSPIKGAHNLAADLYYHEVGDEAIRIQGAQVSSFPLHHPHPGPDSPTVGYRIELDSRTLVYATDNEAGASEEHDAQLIEAVRGADVLIHDAHFTPEEYPSRKGWGHSSFEEAVRVASEAGVSVLVLFHHEPDHDDEQMELILERARKLAPDSLTVTAALDRGVLEI
jgi:phosphoribosyl 1,2-cyclic phosphodiesterase